MISLSPLFSHPLFLIWLSLPLIVTVFYTLKNKQDLKLALFALGFMLFIILIGLLDKGPEAELNQRNLFIIAPLLFWSVVITVAVIRAFKKRWGLDGSREPSLENRTHLKDKKE